MKPTITFSGGKELAATLARLAEAPTKRVTTEALTEGAEPIRAAASRLAPRRSPHPDLADHIVVSTQRIKHEETAAVAIGPADGFAYGLPLEIGAAHAPAQPYLRPAFDGNVGKALTTITGAFWTILARMGIARSVSAPSAPGDGAFRTGGAGLGAGNKQAKPRGRR